MQLYGSEGGIACISLVRFPFWVDWFMVHGDGRWLFPANGESIPEGKQRQEGQATGMESTMGMGEDIWWWQGEGCYWMDCFWVYLEWCRSSSMNSSKEMLVGLGVSFTKGITTSSHCQPLSLDELAQQDGRFTAEYRFWCGGDEWHRGMYYFLFLKVVCCFSLMPRCFLPHLHLSAYVYFWCIAFLYGIVVSYLSFNSVSNLASCILHFHCLFVCLFCMSLEFFHVSFLLAVSMICRRIGALDWSICFGKGSKQDCWPPADSFSQFSPFRVFLSDHSFSHGA